MNKIFNTLTKRTIKQNIKQFLAIIFIVFLGTTLLCGFITNSNSLEKSISNYFSDTNLADIWVYTDKVATEDEEFFDNLEGVLKYDKRLYIETSATLSDDGFENNAKVYVSKGRVSTPYISGTVSKGCFIDKNVAKDKGIKICNDEISFSVPYNYLGQDIHLSLLFTITDTMTLDECADTYTSWPIFIDEETFLKQLNKQVKSFLQSKGIVIEEDVVSSVPYNQILIKTNNVDVVTEKIQGYYNSEEKVSDSSLILIQNQDMQESVVLLNGEISQAQKMIYVFPVIFFVVCVLVILTTINQLVLQEKPRIGTLKSIGISNKTILMHYCSYGAIFCAIGAFFGSILGVILIPNIMFIKYNLVYSLPIDYMNIYVPFEIIFLMFIFVVLLGFLISFFACKNIISKKPIDCLRFEINRTKFKKRKLNMKNGSLSFKMAFRNIKIKPIRTFMAIIGIAGCVALLICGFGINDTLNYSLSNDLDKMFVYDVTSTYQTNDFEEKLSLNSNVDDYETYNQFYVQAKTNSSVKNVNLYVIKEQSKLTSIKLNNGEVFVSKSIADELGLKIGDDFSVISNSEVKTLKVSQIGQTSVMNGVFVAGFDIENTILTKGVWISCKTNVNEVCSYVNEINGTNTAKTKAQMWDRINNQISSIDLMTSTLKVFAILLAVVVLVSLLLLIIKERIRELATLKVLGQGIISISLTLFFEMLFMTVIGAAIGSLLGYPLLVLVLSINKVEVVNYLYHINFASYLFACLIVLLTIVIVQFLVVFKVKKINMIESLKSVE